MTEQELREKIVEVISQKQTYGITEEFKTEDLGHGGWQAWTETTKVNNAEIADALIAAGIGDVKDVEAEANRYEMLYKLQNRDMALAERRAHDVEHRAEVAEKELLVYKEVVGAMLCEIDCFNEGYCPEFYKDPECENCIKKKIYGNSAATFPCLLDKYIKQAEKELQEEKKSD